MQIQGTLRAGYKRVAKIKVRIIVKGLPSGGQVDVTDVLFQPGGYASGWLPHVTELPWSAGVVP